MGAIYSRYTDELRNCCCDIKLVIIASKKLEHILEQNFGSHGKGLHDKISSADGIKEPLKRKMRKIATIRNKLIHTVDYDHIEDRDKFMKEFYEAAAELEEIMKKRNATGNGCIVM